MHEDMGRWLRKRGKGQKPKVPAVSEVRSPPSRHHSCLLPVSQALASPRPQSPHCQHAWAPNLTLGPPFPSTTPGGGQITPLEVRKASEERGRWPLSQGGQKGLQAWVISFPPLQHKTGQSHLGLRTRGSPAPQGLRQGLSKGSLQALSCPVSAEHSGDTPARPWGLL